MDSKKTVQDFIKRHGLKTGDAFLTKITPLNWSKHYILILDADNLVFMQNTIGVGINRPTLNQVANELEAFQRIMRFPGNDYQRSSVVINALEIEARRPKYYVAIYNCEDFVRESWTGIPSSTQVGFVSLILGLAGLGTLVYGFTKKNNAAKIFGTIFLLGSVGTLLLRENERTKIRRYKTSNFY